jgi:hypothetical protein
VGTNGILEFKTRMQELQASRRESRNLILERTQYPEWSTKTAVVVLMVVLMVVRPKKSCDDAAAVWHPQDGRGSHVNLVGACVSAVVLVFVGQ